MVIVVETNTGKIKGYEVDDLKIFKGIPYAEPPIGELRLNVPKPKKPWSGVIDASEYKPVAPQPPPYMDNFPPPPQSEEECLNLNIWTPGCDTKKRPVLFWIHGGSHIYGSGRLLNGRSISRKGNIVLVSINYRLGPLGYLHIPGAPANIGQLDQIAALSWVRDNIEFFGGDPSNVTIFGESAGATSIFALMTMSKAKGLFNRAVAQSGGARPNGFELSIRQTTAETILKELNLGINDLDEYRKLPTEEIIKALTKAQQKAILTQIPLDFKPWVDNETLPKHPIKAIQEGFAKEIELIVGTNLEEMRFWRAFEPKFEERTPSQIEKRISNLMSSQGEDVTKLEDIINIYKKSREDFNLPVNIHEIYEAIMTDSIFRISSIKFAEAQSKQQPNTFMYLFKWKTPYQNGRFGSMHALEIAFVFGSFWEDYLFTFPKKTVETEVLSKKMMNYWLNFARNGNPNYENALKWPTYDTESRKTIIFDKKIEIMDDPLKLEREMWYNMNQWSRF